MATLSFPHAEQLAREAFHLCLTHNIYHAQELLLRTRNELKRLSGDLPIVGHEPVYENTDATVNDGDVPFLTRSFEEARAWGWLELASGTDKLVQDRPGTSLVHFKRAWSIWRPWSMEKTNEAIAYEATRERIRAGFWLGEAWSRFMSDRAEPAANAVLRAALAELARSNFPSLLEETISQQSALPPAQRGTLAYRADNRTVPYVSILLSITHEGQTKH